MIFSDSNGITIFTDWRLLFAFVPADILENSSILHVAFLVFLRLRTIQNPLTSRNGSFRRLKHFVALIWIILIIPRIVFFLLLSLKMSDEFSSFAHAILHVFYTIPTIGIIFMYCVLVRCVRKSKKKNQDEMFQVGVQNQRSDDTKMNSIVARLVLILLICYLPFLINKSYMYYQMITDESYQLGKSNITKAVSVTIFLIDD